MTPAAAQRTPQRVTRLVSAASPNRESRDSIGIGKLVEGQLREVIRLIKERRLLNEPPPHPMGDRGIVIAAGGKYLDYGWVNAKWLRTVIQTQLPIQMWHLGPAEVPARYRRHFQALDVELVDAFQVRERHWHRRLHGWELKLFSATRAPFQHVAFYDADSFARVDPNTIFDSPQYAESGAIFWKDVNRCRVNNWLWFYAQIQHPDVEMDSGTFFIDRCRAWPGLLMSNWLNEHSEVIYRLVYGDKDVADVGFRTTNTPFHLAESTWDGHGIGHHLNGTRIASHAMAFKRKETAAPDPVIPRLFEEWRSLR